MANNLREDFGGQVGGSYMLIWMLLMASLLAQASMLSSMAREESRPRQWLQDRSRAATREHMWETAEFDWITGLEIPSWAELLESCVLVAEGINTPYSLYLCKEPSDVRCSQDDELTMLYGTPVYLCAIA